MDFFTSRLYLQTISALFLTLTACSFGYSVEIIVQDQQSSLNVVTDIGQQLKKIGFSEAKIANDWQIFFAPETSQHEFYSASISLNNKNGVVKLVYGLAGRKCFSKEGLDLYNKILKDLIGEFGADKLIIPSPNVCNLND